MLIGCSCFTSLDRRVDERAFSRIAERTCAHVSISGSLVDITPELWAIHG